MAPSCLFKCLLWIGQCSQIQAVRAVESDSAAVIESSKASVTSTASSAGEQPVSWADYQARTARPAGRSSVAGVLMLAATSQTS